MSQGYTPMTVDDRPTRSRIALYYPWIYLTSGAERTILKLTARSRHEWTLFTNYYVPESTFPGFAARHVVQLPRVTVQRSIGAVARSAFHILTQRLPLDDQDALVVVCEGLGDLAVFRSRSRPALCICLTPLRAVFDPEYRRRAMAGRGRAGRAMLTMGARLFRTVDRLAWKRYVKVFCISEECRARAMAGGLSARAPLELLHPGVGIESERPGSAFEPFFLMPGRIMWTKNLELGIAAFREFKASYLSTRCFRLIIAGGVDEKSRPYLRALRALAGDTPTIDFRIAPTDAELATLYDRCYAVLFPAFNEDWGIVPLEAMSFGKPVIATNRGGPREVITAGLDGFLEEPTEAAFARRMRHLADDPALARLMGRAGFRRSQQFSWDAFTSRIDDCLDQLAGARQPAIEAGHRQEAVAGQV